MRIAWDLGLDGWMLYWKTLEPEPRYRKRSVEGIIQLPLFDPEPRDLAVGAEAGSGATRPRPHLHLVGEQTQDEAPEP